MCYRGTVLLLYAVLTLTFPRDEGYTFDSFIGMDCPPPVTRESVPTSYISRVETGRTELKVSTFYRIIAALGLTVELTPAV